MDGVSIQLVAWRAREATFVHILHLGQICNLQTVQFNMQFQKKNFISYRDKNGYIMQWDTHRVYLNFSCQYKYMVP